VESPNGGTVGPNRWGLVKSGMPRKGALDSTESHFYGVGGVMGVLRGAAAPAVGSVTQQGGF
jgi:hypothetical protein